MSPILYIIILAIIVIFSAIMTVLWRNNNDNLRNLISSSIINFVIIYLAVMSFSLNDVSTLFEGLILLGLVAGLLADIFFCFSGKDNQIDKFVLVAKIVSFFMFLIAIVYITTVTWIYGFVLGILLTIFAVFSDKIFKIDTSRFKWVLPIYAIIIGTIFGQCFFQIILGAFTVVNLLALIGFGVLLIADFMWIYNLFDTKRFNLQKVASILYYLSQVIIASLIFFV